MRKKVEKRFQHFALDETGHIVNIHNVENRNQHFCCPYCKHEMITKMGKIRDWHFAHKHSDDDCDYDNYLHSIAEFLIYGWLSTSSNIQVIVKTIERCEHFYSCKLKDEYYCSKDIYLPPIDINKWIDNWTIEKNFSKNGQEFRADIFGNNKYNEENPIFIEICVTHPCEKEKIESGIKIIEFKVESEDDIINIINSPIKEGDKTRFYNFKPKELQGQWDNYSNNLKRFILYSSGKAYMESINCHKLNKHWGIFEIAVPMSIECEDVPVQIGGEFWSQASALFAACYIMANKQFPFAKHCNICRWHCITNFGEKICKLYKKCHTQRYCDENNPLACQYFQVDWNLRNNLSEMINSLIKRQDVSIWKKDKSHSN